MAEIPPCVGGSECGLVQIAKQARGKLGNPDNELASCVSSENGLGGHALNVHPETRKKSSEQEGLEKSATFLMQSLYWI